MAIKLLLLAAFSAVAVAAARLGPSPRHLAVRRLLATGLLVVSGLSVLFPGVVTDLARLLGVGRGTDLVVYVLVVVSAVTWLGMYRRLSELEARLTRLIRAQALSTPVYPDLEQHATTEPHAARHTPPDTALGADPRWGISA